MGDVLGFGISHYPMYSVGDADMADLLRYTLEDPDIPAERKDPEDWSPPMRLEWGNDNGAAAAAGHRAQLARGLRKARAALDTFAPDVVIVWGDDQYENFREDIVPAFCVQAWETQRMQPWKHVPPPLRGKTNYWNEPVDTTVEVRGDPVFGKHLASALLESDFDIAYSYRPLHSPGYTHAFLNMVLYLDQDRIGFPYPIVPIVVNCYGRRAISARGGMTRFAHDVPFDPPSPTPRRCFALGRAVGRIAARSPHRVALCASSSWSHAFLVDHNWRLFPDTVRDRSLYEALLSSDYDAWQCIGLGDVERAGQQEMLNWFCLAGAMSELGCTLAWSDFVETHVFNSNKVTAIYEPYRTAAEVPA